MADVLSVTLVLFAFVRNSDDPHRKLNTFAFVLPWHIELPYLCWEVPAMSIGFESPDVALRKLRERLRAMSDEELIKFGKYARGLYGLRVSGESNPFKGATRGSTGGMAQAISETTLNIHNDAARWG